MTGHRFQGPNLTPPAADPATLPYGQLAALYRHHIAAETAWVREMNTQRAEWEKVALQLQALLQPYWDAQIAAKYPDEKDGGS